MIGRVLKRGRQVHGLFCYLYSPGKSCPHSNPHRVWYPARNGARLSHSSLACSRLRGQGNPA
jgi:hypothetical protein